MANFEQSKSEGFKGNRTTVTRVGISTNVHNDIAAEETRKINGEKLAARAEKIGRPSTHVATLILKGSTDRLQAVPYNPNKFENKQDQEAYREGFYEHGNRELLGNLEQLTNEQLQAIGRNDYISGLSKTEIPEKVKENSSYVIGHIMASIYDESINYSKEKGR